MTLFFFPLKDKRKMFPSLFICSLSNSVNGAGDPAKPESNSANGPAGH